jgi:hypothetical protein
MDRQTSNHLKICKIKTSKILWSKQETTRDPRLKDPLPAESCQKDPLPIQREEDPLDEKAGDESNALPTTLFARKVVTFSLDSGQLSATEMCPGSSTIELPNAMPKQIPLCSTLKRTLANAEKFID